MTIPSPKLSPNSSDLFEKESTNAVASEDNSKEHYFEIGTTLLLSERLYLNVGIPLLPATFSTILNCFSSTKPEITQLLKESLVNINTKTLLNYCDDLSRPVVEMSSEQLAISIPNSQRYFFPTLATFAASVCIVPALILPGPSLSLSLIIGLFFTSFAAFASCEIARDSYRRGSFRSVLEMEIERRQGRNKNGGGTPTLIIPLCG